MSKAELRNQRIACAVVALLCLPIIILYITFFKQAFFDAETGAFTMKNFAFLYRTMELKLATIPPIGPAMRNTIIFTVIVTLTEVVISCMAGYAISRLNFTGRSFIKNMLLVLRMFQMCIRDSTYPASDKTAVRRMVTCCQYHRFQGSF